MRAIDQQEWERVTSVRHRACGSIVYLSTGSTPQCPVCGRCQASIRRVIRQRGRCTVRELKQATHSARHSGADWDRAFALLMKAGEVRVELGPKGKKTVILLKEED